MNETCLIIGASHAGVQLALSLHQGGWTGPVTLLGEEACPPYQKPPLSKDFLTGAKTLEQIPIRPPAMLEKAGLHLRTGCRVDRIDRENRTVLLGDGEVLGWDRLALATGARPRTLPLDGAWNTGVHYLRTAQDVQDIRGHTARGKRAVIIGGGYIGLEAAASMRKLGMEVSVLEAMPRVLQRVTAPEVSAFFQRLHSEEGVNIICDARVDSIAGDGAVEHVQLADGGQIDADLVLIAVGVQPNVELAEAAGLKTDDGIVVDEFCRTSDTAIVAAGDCTRHHNPLYDRRIRLESIQNATDQAKAAAATLCGSPSPYNALPWFWSDQYDVKLQIAGISDGFDNCVLRGDPADGRSFAVFYFAGDRLLAADAVNRPAEFMTAKKLLMNEQTVDKQALADEQVSVKSLLGA
jgi:3-phenylpropionate/trans-cinnamate dioxygenase ferredoxin reductase subunit